MNANGIFSEGRLCIYFVIFIQGNILLTIHPLRNYHIPNIQEKLSTQQLVFCFDRWR